RKGRNLQRCAACRQHFQPADRIESHAATGGEEVNLLVVLMAALLAGPQDAPKAKISFVKDVVPILTKSGCANSNCHGSIRGQGGFKLSLFGYEPELDYEAITKNQDGRRVDRAHPEKSLVLVK